MTILSLISYFDSILNNSGYPNDIALNGLQVANSLVASGGDVAKVAFAVDASCDSIMECARVGAKLLFVHHGLYWGKCYALVGADYRRIKALMEHDIALYASHVPLDANPIVGNNWGLARRLGLGPKLEGFGLWRAMTIGVKGNLAKPLTIQEALARLLVAGQEPFAILPFGPKLCTRVGLISGGAGEEVREAVEAGLDLYITGAISHEDYNYVKENKINVIALGHYNSETVGPALLAQKLYEDTSTPVELLDLPTGL